MKGVYLKPHCLIVLFKLLANFRVDCIHYSNQKVIKIPSGNISTQINSDNSQAFFWLNFKMINQSINIIMLYKGRRWKINNQNVTKFKN